MKILALFLLTFFSLAAHSDMALAKAAPSYPHKIDDLIKHFSKNKANKSNLDLAVLGKDVFGVKEIYNFSSDPAQITSENLVRGIQDAISTEGKWDSKLPAPKLKKLEANKKFLSQTFGESSYEWAWVQNQLGDKAIAKKNLQILFDQEHASIMAEKQAVFGFGRSPMARIESLYQALGKLSDEKEKEVLEERMSKAKQHFSSLPQSHIMT